MMQRYYQKLSMEFGSRSSDMNAILAKIADFKANEVETLDAVSFYMDKPKQLVKIFDYQYYLLASDEVVVKCTRFDQALTLVLEALTNHVKNLKVLIKGSLVLWGIVAVGEHQAMVKNVTVKRLIMTTLLNGIDYHKYDKKLMRHAFGVLIFYGIDKEKELVMYEHKRFFQLSLYMIRTRFIISYGLKNDFYLSTGMYVIDCTISSGSGINNEQKTELGDAGAIKIMLTIMRDRIRRKHYDLSVRHCWMIMEKLTRNVPDNCKRFLDESGIKCFLKSIKAIEKRFVNEPGPNNILDNLLQDMFGVLRNVSQSENLRPRLMKVDLIKVLSNYLTKGKFLTSYLIAEVIAHLASDGHKAWTIKTPARCEVLDGMRNAIKNWNQDATLDLTVCSLNTILQLIKCRHTPQCVQWAVWTLARLTKVYPEKYCLIVVAAGGLRILSELLLQDYTLNYQNTQLKIIHNLAQTVINQCEQMKNTAE